MAVAGNICIISIGRKEQPYYYICASSQKGNSTHLSDYMILHFNVYGRMRICSSTTVKHTLFFRDTVEFVKIVLSSLTLVTDLIVLGH